MQKMNLKHFSGTLTVTVVKDDHITTATASPSSSLAKDDEVTLSITPASNYELKEIEVVAGGVTVDPTTKKFTMGESNVVIAVKSKPNNLYKVVETHTIYVNGQKTVLQKNMQLELGILGTVVDVKCAGTTLSLNAEMIADLVKTGVIIKM